MPFTIGTLISFWFYQNSLAIICQNTYLLINYLDTILKKVNLYVTHFSHVYEKHYK